MTQIFISDLHLDPSRPETTEAFLALLRAQCQRIDSLFILGDLFEAWIGDDDDDVLCHTVRNALAECRATGTRIYLQRGNRDFLLGKHFSEHIGAQLLPDYAVIECAGEATLLMHGDLLCTDDLEYLNFRAHVRTPQWQSTFLSQSLMARRAFAEQARQASHARQSQLLLTQQLDSITDVNLDTVVETMLRYGVRRLIHGHTHRPARHSIQRNGYMAERIVLGDWYEQASSLVVAENHIQLNFGPAP